MDVAKSIDEVVSEFMSYEHALTYILCLSKCQSVNSLNLVMEYLRDKDHYIKTLKFLNPVICLVPRRVS